MENEDLEIESASAKDLKFEISQSHDGDGEGDEVMSCELEVERKSHGKVYELHDEKVEGDKCKLW